MPRDPDALFAAKKKKRVPFDFVLDELSGLDPWTRPMFGCTAVYVEEKIIFILREKRDDGDDGVWVATRKEHHTSLRQDLPNLRSIAVFGAGETGWQLLPTDAEDFEESVLKVCALVRAGDPRVGKVPRTKKKKKKREDAARETPRRPRKRA